MEKLAKKQREVWEKKCIALQSFIRRSYAIAAFEDLKRRNAAAIVFQRHIRSTLTLILFTSHCLSLILLQSHCLSFTSTQESLSLFIVIQSFFVN